MKTFPRPYSVDFSEPQLTDQSYANACDINVIMAQYAKTGLLPQNSTIHPRYIDTTQVPTLEQAFSAVNSALEAFNNLPPTIRKLMDNDPSQLENFIADPNNADLLLKHGILIQTKPPESTLSKVPPEAQPPKTTEKT